MSLKSNACGVAYRFCPLAAETEEKRLFMVPLFLVMIIGLCPSIVKCCKDQNSDFLEQNSSQG